jgi:hypothetical protein
MAILVASIQKKTHRGSAEAQSKTFLIKKYSELGELCVSVVNNPHRTFLVAASPR